MRRGAAPLLVLLGVLGAIPAWGRKPGPVPCAGGAFAVQGAPLTTGQASPAPARIAFTDSRISIVNVCDEPVPLRRTVHKKVTALTATWASCGGLAGEVRLRAKIRAPACSSMRGVVTAKQARPRRQKFTAARLGSAAIAAVLKDIDTQARMLDENLPTLIRGAAEPYNPELVALIAQGSAAVDGILEEFRRPAGLDDETALSLLAYALERIGDPRAVPVLTDWLEQHLFASLMWATDFVTHTIKVLDGQGGLSTESYTYLIDEKLDTIAAARAGEATARRHGPGRNAATPLAAASVSTQNDCPKTISVTGINADGRQETVKLGFTSVFYDINEQIDLETDPTRRTRLSSLRQRYETADEEFYGGTDYQPIGEVSVASNCGGSVTERLLNAVAVTKGLPLRLGSGNAGADDIRGLARKFGSEVGATALDTLTVIAHERENGASAHVEIPVSADGSSAVVYSKDNQGKPRLHTVSKGSAVNSFGPVQQRYNFRPFSNYAQTTPKFYRIDPSRIVSIVVDSSACPCEWAAGGVIPVTFTEPSGSETDQRVVTVAGTVGAPDVTSGNLRVNGSAQGVTVGAGAFSAQVVLSSGDNTLRLAVDGPDGRRGCAERTLRSTTPKTTISATLTWNLDDADVDLYTAQPDGETAWYGRKTTSIGGRLDVDNTRGRGPENYFLSAEEGDTVLPGTYTVRVHYYRDHLKSADTPTRIVAWRVVIILDEGTPAERREFQQGSLAVDNSGNASPGASGADWATAAQVSPATP